MFKLLHGIIVVLVLHLASCQEVIVRREIQRHLELEDVLSEAQLFQQRNIKGLEYWVWRSEANNLKVLRIEDENRRYSVNIRLCISPIPPFRNVTVQVESIRYSNDGPGDTMFLLLDNIPITNGTFRTFEKWGGGNEWNVFHHTGPIGQPIQLAEGEYTLSLQAVTDRWGLEYDQITINAENQNELVKLICDSELTGPTPQIKV